MRRYIPAKPEKRLSDEELESASPITTKNHPSAVPPSQKAPKRKREEVAHEPSLIAAASTLTTVPPTMLAVDMIRPPAASYDATGERVPRSEILPAAARHGGYHREQEPVGASNAMLSELLTRQNIMQSSRRRLAFANSSTVPIISDLLYPQSSPVAASLLPSPLYAGLRGAPLFLTLPNTLYPGRIGDVLVSIPPYAPSNRDPRLSQPSVPARDAYNNPLLLYELPYDTNASTVDSSLLGGAVDPYRGILHAHPLLAAAQQRSALLAAAYLSPPPAQSPQESHASDTLLSLGQRANSSCTGSSSAGGPEAFPIVLYRALSDLELAEGGTAIATFLPGGKSFLIRNQFLFERRVLPLFFPKMKSFASFQRQLNLYDFKRIGGAGVDRGAYHHALFTRGSPDDASRIKRTKIKGGPVRGPARRNRDRLTHRDGDDGT